jgi:cytochrome c5
MRHSYRYMKMRMLIRMVPALLLGVAAAVLVSCGSSGVGLIPAASAGPLQKDFEAVAQAAQAGDGSCVATESALGKTEQDFLALPTTVNKGLRTRLDQGIANLRKRALEICAQPAPGSTTTTNTQTTTTNTTPQTPTSTQTTTTSTTPSTPTSTTPPTPPTPAPGNQGGGTAAPGEGESEGEAGTGKEGAAGSNNGGANVGGASPGDGQ